MANRLEELKNAKILKRELNERASRLTLNWKTSPLMKINSPTLLVENRIAAITVYFYHLMEILE